MVKIIEQSYEIITNLDGLVILRNIEKAARTCYKSEHLITENGESAKKLCRMLVKRGHTAMLEFGGMIHVLIICNRGLTHELVRHRLNSFAQESTRYCDYSKDKHGNEITVILPIDYYGIDKELLNYTEYISIEHNISKNLGTNKNNILNYKYWKDAMENAEKSYFALRERGVPPQIARGVLPIDVKTEINIAANPTQWRHIFRLRTSEAAHPQIRAIMKGILKDFKEKIPIIFDDL